MDIGTCLGQGWDAFKARPVPQIVATILVIVIMAAIQATNSVIPFLGSLASIVLNGLFMGGLTVVALKAIRGEEIAIPDVFTPFRDRPVDYLVVGLVMQAGVVLCGIGVIATMLIFFFAPVMVALGSDYKSALGFAKDMSFANFGNVLLLAIVLFLINLVAAIPLGLGLLVTIPMSYAAIVSAYNQLQARALPAQTEPSPHVTPPPGE
jgi:hypothetical protein